MAGEPCSEVTHAPARAVPHRIQNRLLFTRGELVTSSADHRSGTSRHSPALPPPPVARALRDTEITKNAASWADGRRDFGQYHGPVCRAHLPSVDWPPSGGTSGFFEAAPLKRQLSGEILQICFVTPELLYLMARRIPYGGPAKSLLAGLHELFRP